MIGSPRGFLARALALPAALVSANPEWKALRALRPAARRSPSPYGDGGWGKIDAAASAQHAIDRWRPEVLLNLGTCGGFRGGIGVGEVVLAAEILVYDIVEQMGDATEATADYTTRPDLGWTRGGDPPGVKRGRLISADRDVIAADVPKLRATWPPWRPTGSQARSPTSRSGTGPRS